jgi:hypothetical protein
MSVPVTGDRDGFQRVRQRFLQGVVALGDQRQNDPHARRLRI